MAQIERDAWSLVVGQKSNMKIPEIATVIQAAQELASELMLETLLEKLLRMALEYVGAQRVCLILDQAGKLVIAAEATSDQVEITLPQSAQVETSQRLSSAAVEYVRKSGESLVLADATQDRAFAHDPYVIHHQPKSILCLPVLSHGHFIGILYLEHHLLTDCFTPERIEVTETLLAHAAIALENARLYEETRREIAERRQAENVLRSISEATATVVGGDFLHSLMRHLATIFNVRCAFVAECTDATMTRVRTLAFFQDGDFVDNTEYDLEGTPCHRVVGGEVGYYPENLESLFPGSDGLESYLGVPLTNSLGNILGHMAVSDDRPMHRTSYDIAMLKIFAARAGAELERQRAEESLRQREEELRHLNERLSDYNRHLEQTVAERTHEIERRRQVAERLRDMLAILNSNRPLDEMLTYIVEEATSLLGTESGAIYRLQPENALLVVQSWRGLPEEYIQNLSFPMSQSFLGRAMLSRRPIVISNLPAVVWGKDIQLDAQRRAMLAQYHTLLAVPLARLGTAGEVDEVYGGLALYYHQERKFSDEEIGLMVAFADQAALAIENAQLRQRARQAAVLEERGRLARELHDSVTQSLYSLTLLAEGWRRLAAAGRLEHATEALAELGGIGQQALKEMRLLVHQLRPPALEKDGLLGALHQRLASVEQRAGVEVRLLADELPDLPALVEEGLYRIAQEALNNSLKHAQSTAVTVHLRSAAAWVELEVVDNGQGFDLALVGNRGGVGLESMRERAEQLGGTFTITAAPGEGTRVRIRVPCPIISGEDREDR